MSYCHLTPSTVESQSSRETINLSLSRRMSTLPPLIGAIRVRRCMGPTFKWKKARTAEWLSLAVGPRSPVGYGQGERSSGLRRRAPHSRSAAVWGRSPCVLAGSLSARRRGVEDICSLVRVFGRHMRVWSMPESRERGVFELPALELCKLSGAFQMSLAEAGIALSSILRYIPNPSRAIRMAMRGKGIGQVTYTAPGAPTP